MWLPYVYVKLLYVCVEPLATALHHVQVQRARELHLLVT